MGSPVLGYSPLGGDRPKGQSPESHNGHIRWPAWIVPAVTTVSTVSPLEVSSVNAVESTKGTPRGTWTSGCMAINAGFTGQRKAGEEPTSANVSREMGGRLTQHTNSRKQTHTPILAGGWPEFGRYQLQRSPASRELRSRVTRVCVLVEIRRKGRIEEKGPKGSIRQIGRAAVWLGGLTPIGRGIGARRLASRPSIAGLPPFFSAR
ncbi:hypothetical protein R1flu_020511 [Riccia fluitans]|uniref:Uncharacterized protein n=1 Tax=Riccia fluitans TaxID=41844 RepID=A0ABD1ZLY5_9MARC